MSFGYLKRNKLTSSITVKCVSITVKMRLKVIYIYVGMIDCSESDSIIEICGKLDKSNT